jgi:hypothetical protein
MLGDTVAEVLFSITFIEELGDVIVVRGVAHWAEGLLTPCQVQLAPYGVIVVLAMLVQP